MNGRLAFVELDGRFVSGGLLINTGYASGAILHLGYNGVAGTPTQLLNDANISTVYVGSGESQAADQAVLNQYLADPDWAQYASKLDLWFNYSGEYKAMPIINQN